MPPKKDDKKGKGGSGTAVKDVDPTWYIRKSAPLPETNQEKQLPIPKITGKIINVEKLFSVWNDDEMWGEPIAPEKVPQINFPSSLKIEGKTTISAFYELDVPDPNIPVDPKAKKDAKKDNKKGKKDAKEDIELLEVPVNENNRPMPYIYTNINKNNPDEYLQYPTLKDFVGDSIGFLQEEFTTTTENASISTDPVLCQTFQLIFQLGYNISNYYDHETTKEKFQENYLWKAVYPKIKGTSKPVYNPAGKYAVRLFIANAWRKVYVDDTIPLLANGKPALAFSRDKYELWPLILSKAIYTVYSACGYTFADEIMDSSGNNYNIFNTSKVVQFINFATYLLTGWLPHHSTAMNAFFTQEKTKSLKLLEYLLSNGIPQIATDDLLPSDNPYTFNEIKEINKYNVPEVIVEAPPVVAPVSTKEPSPTAAAAAKGKKGGKEKVSPTNAAGTPATPAPGTVPPTPAPETQKEPIPEETKVEETEEDLVKKTKRRFKQEYAEKKQLRDQIVDFINRRELQVNNIQQTLQQHSQEMFMVLLFDSSTQTYQSYPVLGVAYGSNLDTSPNLLNMLDMKLLLQWKPYCASMVTPKTNDPIILGKYKLPIPEFLEPYPVSTPVDYTWKSVKELMEAEAYFVGMFMTYDLPHEATWTHQWMSLTPEVPVVDPKAAKGKGKDVKGAVPSPVDESKYTAPGNAPVMLLSLDPRSLYEAVDKELEQTQTMIYDGNTNNDGKSVEELEMQEALQAQQQEFEESQKVDEGSLLSHQSSCSAGIGVNLNIKLMITLSADISTDYAAPTAANGELLLSPSGAPTPSAALAQQFLNARQSWEVSSVGFADGKPKILPSNTVLIIQELRFDTSEPIMHVIKLKDDEALPLITKTITIPFNKLQLENRTEPLIFWVRLFTTTSITMYCHANVPVAVDLAEKLWKTQASEKGGDIASWSALCYEGESDVTVDATEQILFRVPLLTNAVAASDPESTIVVPNTEPITIGSGGGGKGEVIDANTNSYTMLDGPKAMAFLYINEDPIDKLCELFAVTTRDDKCVHIDELSHVRGQLISLSTDKMYMDWLMGLIHTHHFQSDSSSFTKLIPSATENTRQIPKFKWKLIVLAKVPILDPVMPIPSQSIPTTGRFQGKYIPNKHLRLFRDVYSIEKTTLPIAFKFSVHTLLAQEDMHESIVENIAFLVRFYRKGDNKLLAEYHGTDVLHCYYQDAAHFIAIEEPGMSSRPASSKDGKGKAAPPAAKGGKGKDVVVVETTDVIIEALLNEEHMHIPSTWRSRFPHVFDDFFVMNPDDPANASTPSSEGMIATQEILKAQASFLSIKPPSTPLLTWSIDILAGKVSTVSHDITQSVKFQDTKKTWWEDSTIPAGRQDKAIAAGTYMKEFSTALVDTMKAKDEFVVQQFLHRQAVQEGTEVAEEIPPVLPSVPLTSTMTESLVTSLALDIEQLSKRFETLHKVYEAEEKIEIIKTKRQESLINPHNETLPPIGSVAWDAQVQAKVKESKENIETSYEQLTTKSSELLEIYRETCKQRILTLTENYRLQRNEMLSMYQERERYRQEIENKNKSLMVLLKRGKDAKQVARDKEAAAEAERLKQEAKNKGKKK